MMSFAYRTTRSTLHVEPVSSGHVVLANAFSIAMRSNTEKPELVLKPTRFRWFLLTPDHCIG
jgi:hypothetical protein